MAYTAQLRRTWRLRLLAAGLLAAIALLSIRLFYLQVIEHDRYVAQAEDSHQGYRKVYAPRGAILDRNGYPLAMSVDTFDLYVDRRAWRDNARARDAATKLSPIIGANPDDILRAVTPGPGGDQLLVKALDYERGDAVARAGAPGVKVAPASRRTYPEGNLAAALVGFVGKDPVGLSGVEADFDWLLAGKPGSALFDRDAAGNEIVIGRRDVRAAKPGPNIALTVDRNIQRLVEVALDRTIEQHKATGGDIIVQDPHTGAILAMATRPSFSLLQPDLRDNIDLGSFRNRAIADQYEPGSVFKLITMAAAIDQRTVTPETTYNDSGVLKVYDTEIKNFDKRGYGTQTMTQVLQNSLNTGSAWVAQRLGADAFYRYVKAFGFGELTGIELAGEASGTYRTPNRNDWTPVDLVTNSFGQGISVTPLQAITAVSAIVNGGTLMRPYVVQEIAGAGKREATRPKVVRRVISEETSRTMRSMMNKAVDEVPGHRAQVAGYDVGGKTGTANISSDGYKDTTIVSFVGVVPADNPRFVMLVKIDGPGEGALGSYVAAPVFSELAPQLLRYLKIPPTDARVLHTAPAEGTGR